MRLASKQHLTHHTVCKIQIFTSPSWVNHDFRHCWVLRLLFLFITLFWHKPKKSHPARRLSTCINQASRATRPQKCRLAGKQTGTPLDVGCEVIHVSTIYDYIWFIYHCNLTLIFWTQQKSSEIMDGHHVQHPASSKDITLRCEKMMRLATICSPCPKNSWTNGQFQDSSEWSLNFSPHNRCILPKVRENVDPPCQQKGHDPNHFKFVIRWQTNLA